MKLFDRIMLGLALILAVVAFGMGGYITWMGYVLAAIAAAIACGVQAKFPLPHRFVILLMFMALDHVIILQMHRVCDILLNALALPILAVLATQKLYSLPAAAPPPVAPRRVIGINAPSTTEGYVAAAKWYCN